VAAVIPEVDSPFSFCSACEIEDRLCAVALRLVEYQLAANKEGRSVHCPFLGLRYRQTMYRG
jgi:hypothetical protein